MKNGLLQKVEKGPDPLQFTREDWVDQRRE
jgi:hypothetical protein